MMYPFNNMQIPCRLFADVDNYFLEAASQVEESMIWNNRVDFRQSHIQSLVNVLLSYREVKRVPQRYKQITTDIQGRWNRRRISRITFVQFQDYPTRRCIFHFHEWFGLNSASGKLGEEVPCPNLNLQPTSPDLWKSNQFICTDQNICKTYKHMYRIYQHVLIHCKNPDSHYQHL